MAFSPGDFKSQLIYGGSRGNLFQFNISFPQNLVANAGVASAKISFMAKAASLPASTLPAVEVPYFGRTIKVAGDRQFNPFNVTVINDEDFVVRNALEAWSNAIKTHETNLGIVKPADYKVDFEVIQYGKDSTIIKTYKFVGSYPTDISEIGLDWGNNNSIEEFNVTFSVDYWTANTTS